MTPTASASSTARTFDVMGFRATGKGAHGLYVSATRSGCS